MAPHSTSPLPQAVETSQETIRFSSVLQAELQPKTKPKAPLRTIFPPLELEAHPIDEVFPIKAIVVGAGIAGINAGIILPRKVPGLELVIYEKTSDVVSKNLRLCCTTDKLISGIGGRLEHKYLSWC